jgi:hypothetical protein
MCPKWPCWGAKTWARCSLKLTLLPLLRLCWLPHQVWLRIRWRAPAKRGEGSTTEDQRLKSMKVFAVRSCEDLKASKTKTCASRRYRRWRPMHREVTLGTKYQKTRTKPNLARIEPNLLKPKNSVVYPVLRNQFYEVCLILYLDKPKYQTSTEYIY